MYPTLSLSGDYLLCVRTPLLRTFLSRNAPYVNRGDLIDFVSPRDPTYSVCKRVIGIEGDVVLLDPSGEKGSKRDYIKIPAGYLWVVGDNLSNSNDSREYGPIPLGIVRGKIVSRVSRGRLYDSRRLSDANAAAWIFPDLAESTLARSRPRRNLCSIAIARQTCSIFTAKHPH